MSMSTSHSLSTSSRQSRESSSDALPKSPEGASAWVDMRGKRDNRWHSKHAWFAL